MLELYPDDPADGSPFGMVNETFGLPPEFKRAPAIIGDIGFQSLRRAWINAGSSFGVNAFGYLFADPQPVAATPGGKQTHTSGYYTPCTKHTAVAHGSEVAYIWGSPPFGDQRSPGFDSLSPIMQDYWLSFVTSLTPSDGKGGPRTFLTSFVLTFFSCASADRARVA